MRIRQTSAAVAMLALLGLSACASGQAGTAVAGASAAGQVAASSTAGASSSAGPTSSSAGTPDAPATSSTPAASGGSIASAETTTTVPTSEPTSETTVVSTTSTPVTSASSSSQDQGDVWPTQICKLMPGDLVKGLQLEDGDPQLRCMYTGQVQGKYVNVIISKGSFAVSPDAPGGSQRTSGMKTTTVDGRKVWSWFTSNANSAWATYDVGAKGSVLLSVVNEGKTPEVNRASVLALAKQVSAALRSSAPMSGSATAPPTTTYAKVPAGTRAWPGLICDLLPPKMISEMEKARGFETQSCRLSTDTKEGFIHIEVRRGIRPSNPADPSERIGTQLKKESFDGRTAFSYLGTGSVPTAYVTFSAGGRDWAEIRIAELDISKPIAAEKVRADAVALAQQIAPKLPKP